MTAMFLGPETPLQERFDELDQLVKEFCMDLRQLWRHAGKPSTQRMAEVAQVPQGTLEIFFRDRVMPLPSRLEVQGVLDGTATPQSAQNRWLERHTRLVDRRAELDGERAVVSRREESQRTGGSRRPQSVAVSGPLTAALEAGTMKDLQAALRGLRVGAGLSLERLAKASRGAFSGSTAHRIETDDRVPTREQIVAFVTACGQIESEVGLWVRAWEKVFAGCADSADAPAPRAAEQVERVEIISHPVTYLLGGNVDEQIVKELRLRITPKIELAAGAALGLVTVATAGAAVLGRVTNLRGLFYAASVTGAVMGFAGGVLQRRIDTLDDQTLLELASADTAWTRAKAMLAIIRNQRQPGLRASQRRPQRPTRRPILFRGASTNMG